MACTDLSKGSRDLESDRLSGLCTVCRRIDFGSSTDKMCKHMVEGCQHFHLGPLLDIWKRKSCPGCRLILAVASRCPRIDLSENYMINVRRQAFSFGGPKSIGSGYVADSKSEETCWTWSNQESFLEVVVQPNTCEAARIAGAIVRMKSEVPALGCSTGTIFSEQEDFCVRGRITGREASTTLIKDWMQYCSNWHHSCDKPIPAPAGDIAIRLVDVQDDKVIWATLNDDYVALSYVWGRKTVPLLTWETVSDYFAPGGLEPCALPLTISDAMKLVRAPGNRYLWVDTLCIIQDDENDKQQQLHVMDEIYRRADLLLVAASGNDAYAGLPGVEQPSRRRWQQIESIDGMQFITAQPMLRQVLDQSLWDTRGWTFQEAMLSRRAIIFTDNLMYWSCRCDAWREDISSESSIDSFVLDDDNSLWGSLYDSHDARCRTSFYCWLVRNFYHRKFKEEEDVLWAFVGILKLLSTRFSKGFIWGIPYEKIDAALLWSEVTRCQNVHLRTARHSMVKVSGVHSLPYPTWSWLSTRSRVSFLDTCGDSVVSEVIWLPPLKLASDLSAPAAHLPHTRCTLSWPQDLNDPKDQSQGPGFPPITRVTDFGLLHFVAQTAAMIIREKTEPANEAATEARRFRAGPPIPKVQATLHDQSGDVISSMTIPYTFLDDKSERWGEVVLLSSNAQNFTDQACRRVEWGEQLDCGNIQHVYGCSHIQSRNILLVEWVGGVAYRRGLGTVNLADWAKVETQTKEMVLG